MISWRGAKTFLLAHACMIRRLASDEWASGISVSRFRPETPMAVFWLSTMAQLTECTLLYETILLS